MTTEKFEPKQTVEEILTYPFRDIPDRNITKETCERFGVRTSVDAKTGKPDAHYFPSYNQKGKLVGFTKQDITKDKGEAGHWSTIGSVKIDNKLFGQDVAEGLQRKRKNLIATEGQLDTMSAFQAAVDNVKGTQYDGLEPFIVSIPMGTANAVDSMLHNQEFVKSFESLTTFFDNDEATPNELKKGIMKGHEATEAVMATFVGTGVGLFTITAENGMKDASDYLQAGRSTDLAKMISYGKKAYTPEKIIRASSISLEQVMAPAPEGVIVKQFPKLMEKTSGFHKGALTLVTAPSGAGKTTAVSIVSNSIIEAGQKPGLIYLEETAVETVQRMVAEELHVNFLKFKRKPLDLATEEAIAEAYGRVIEKDPVLLDHFGSIAIDKLMMKIRYMHEIEKCDYIILDHISMTISGLEVADERKELDVAMTEIAAYCASHKVGVIVVCHLNRGGTADQFKTKKGDEDQPFWVRVTKEALRGSASLEQLSMVILALEPEILPNRERGRIRWVVLKNRPTGYLGEADIFKLNDKTWEVELSELEDF